MRIVWSSNSPFCQTGYGIQTAVATQNLKKMGHEVSLFPFFGFQGVKIDWNGIPLYPNNTQDWGVNDAQAIFEEEGADLYISLVDVWVLNNLDQRIPWVPWTPIDHDPVPPLVLETLKGNPSIVKPIAMTRFGQRALKDKGIDAYYLPHTVNTEAYRRDEQIRYTGRCVYEWEDKFVIGTIGTNTVERKNWNATMQGIHLFAKHHGLGTPECDIRCFWHTDPGQKNGINLVLLREALGLDIVSFFPREKDMRFGISRDKMASMINAFDVFLLPSRGEGFGIPLIEAQACGVPVITTKFTGQEELIGSGWGLTRGILEWTNQNSWWVVADPHEIAQYLEEAYQLWKTDKYEEMKVNAREFAMQFSEDRVYQYMWPPVLEDIENRLKTPKNLEGVQPWRLNLIPPSCKPRKVLDLGCGLTKPYEPHLNHLGEYVAVDNRAKEDDGIIKADAMNLPFEDGEFGFVWCSELLEHAEDAQRVLDEAKRVGRHGRMLFSTPQNHFFHMDPEHKVVNLPHTVLKGGDGEISW